MTTYEEVHDAVRQIGVGVEKQDKEELANGIANLLYPIIDAQQRQAKALEDIAAELNAHTSIHTAMMQR